MLESFEISIVETDIFGMLFLFLTITALFFLIGFDPINK